MFEAIVAIIGTVLMVGFIIVALSVCAYNFKRCYFRCVKCHTLYKPETLLKFILGLNAGSQRKLKCPKCNVREWATMIKGDIPIR